jgi:hypothetical protein
MVPQDVILQFAPDVYFHKYERYFPCDIDHLLHSSTLKDRNMPDWSVDNPTQQCLYQYYQGNYYVVINPTQYEGLGITAPLYYAVQEYTDVIEISYIMLYAYQGGQTCKATPLIGEDFDCIISTLGTHQSDVERIVVRVKPYQSEYNVVQVGYEAHGNLTWYLKKDVAFNGTHPIVNVALCGHSCHNMYQTGDRVVDYHIPAVMDIISVLGNDGLVWRPYQDDTLLVQLGLTARGGEPINGQQVWAKFGGKLGNSSVNSLESGYYFDWTNLSFLAWAYVKGVDFLGNAIHAISDELINGNGQDGPAGRDWAYPVTGSLFNDQFTVVWEGTNFSDGPGNIGWLVGNYMGTKYDQALQLFDNGSLGMILYGSDGNGGIMKLWSTGDTGQGPAALQWLSGKFYGDGVDRIIQLCDISGNLGMIMYQATPQSGIAMNWSTSNAGGLGGPFTISSYVAGDFFGDRMTRIVQCANLGGTLGMTVYAANASGQIAQIWSSANMQAGAGAIQWMVGNFVNDSQQQILQLCDISSNLGFIMYGSDGNGGLTQMWGTTTAEGSGAIGFVKGDFNGDAREEVIQLWNNGSLGMIMYGFDDYGVTILWSTGNVQAGPGAFQWLVGDFQGDGKDEILQLWATGMDLGMIMYGSDGNGGMKILWSTEAIGPGGAIPPSGAQYLVGNFMGDGVQEVLQWYGIGQIRGAAYATFG